MSGLPGHIQTLFRARPPLPYKPPTDHAPEKRRTAHIAGLAAFLAPMKAASSEEYVRSQTGLQQQTEAKNAKKAHFAAKLKKDIEEWVPRNDRHIRGDPTRTVFVGRLRYTLEEPDVETEFAKYGPIERLRVVRDTQGKSRGYAFIVFENEQDAQAAKREANGSLIRGRRIVTDFERGRLQASWRPRRLGGGKGGRNNIKEQLMELQRRPFKYARRDDHSRPDNHRSDFRQDRQDRRRDHRQENQTRDRGERFNAPRDTRERRYDEDRRARPVQSRDPGGRTLRRY